MALKLLTVITCENFGFLMLLRSLFWLISSEIFYSKCNEMYVSTVLQLCKETQCLPQTSDGLNCGMTRYGRIGEVADGIVWEMFVRGPGQRKLNEA